MKFPWDAPVREDKLESLHARLAELGVELNEVKEKAVTSSGPGGQKANRSKSGVQLLYKPLGIVVKARRERSRAVNRYLALRELANKVEAKTGGTVQVAGKRAAEVKKTRKQKDRRKRRRRKKTEVADALCTEKE